MELEAQGSNYVTWTLGKIIYVKEDLNEMPPHLFVQVSQMALDVYNLTCHMCEECQLQSSTSLCTTWALCKFAKQVQIESLEFIL